MTRDEIHEKCEQLGESNSELVRALTPYWGGELYFTLDEGSLRNPQSIASMFWRKKGAKVSELGDIDKLLSLVPDYENYRNSAFRWYPGDRGGPTLPTDADGGQPRGRVVVAAEIKRTNEYCGIYAYQDETVSGEITFMPGELGDEDGCSLWGCLEDNGYYGESSSDMEYYDDNCEICNSEDYHGGVTSVSYTDTLGNSYDVSEAADGNDLSLIDEIIYEIEQFISDHGEISDWNVQEIMDART